MNKDMAFSPVETLGSKYPLCKDLINKVSKKWQKRTKNMVTRWPEEGTFDVALCEEMETLVKNYKTKEMSKKNKKREEKREREQEILALFKKEGESLRKHLKQARRLLKDLEQETKAKEQKYADPPPYLSSEGQFPLLKGTVGILGEMQMKGTVEIEDDEEEEEEEREPVVRPKTKSAIATKEKTLQLDCYKQARTALEKMKTQYNIKTPSVKQSYEQAEKEKEESKKEKLLERAVIEKECLFDETYEKSREGEERAESLVDVGKWSRGEEKSLRPLTKQLPILIKGAQGNYVPWASQDLQGLVNRLPDIHEGAGKFIRILEEELAGKLIAVGDIKALLAKIVGGAKTDQILQDANLHRAVNSYDMDGIVFDAYRPAVWRVLRTEYETRIDPKALKGEELGDTENPLTYVQRQLKRWKQETEGDPEGDPLMTTLFRNAIVDAMPQTVKSKLEDVVGLNSKSHKEFCDHVSHAVDLFRKNEQKLKTQEKELRRKLTQLQLEELSNKNKRKIQAAVQKDEHNQMSVMAPVTSPPPAVQLTPPATNPPNAHQTPVPIINVYNQQPGPMGWTKNPPQGDRRGAERLSDIICWGCKEKGHLKRACPSHSWTQSPGGRRGKNWQKSVRGPVNPWVGTNPDF